MKKYFSSRSVKVKTPKHNLLKMRYFQNFSSIFSKRYRKDEKIQENLMVRYNKKYWIQKKIAKNRKIKK